MGRLGRKDSAPGVVSYSATVANLTNLDKTSVEPGVELRVVGHSAVRKEGLEKVLGEAVYVDDMRLPDMWFGATVRSSVARGKITSIKFSEDVPWEEYCVADAKDIPGRNVVPMFLDDQPLLAAGEVNHPEEPILLIAHSRKEALAKALSGVEITYEETPGVFTIADSELPGNTIWGTDNTFKRFLLEKGDIDAVWASADLIVEGEYETGAQEQLYIEPNGVIAKFDESGVTVWGSLQCPFYAHRALKEAFGLPDERVRVIQTETGGAFGGKEEFPSVIAGHAALLAMKSGHPVKMIYDRAEDMAATTKRHPSRTRHKTAVTKEGKLLGCEIEFDIDGGAYATLSATVLSRGTIHAAGPYRWPALRVRSRALATNTPPSGAFRGFGAPQSLFALERHMEKVALAVGLSPAEFRKRNFLRQGETTATGQVISDPVDLGSMLDKVLDHADYHDKRRFYRLSNRTDPIKRGLGIAAFMHGAGFTGSGERYLNSRVGLEAVSDGRVRILVSSTEFGQGTNTILCQIAAEALGCLYDDVLIAQPDTQVVPNSGPTVASRTAMVVGRLVQRCAENMRTQLMEGGYLSPKDSPERFRERCAEFQRSHGKLECFLHYESPPKVFWDDETYRGEAYPAYAWAVYVAEVAVDSATYSVEIENIYAIQEIGKVLNPVLAAGQIEGGIAQGVGFALYEKVVWDKGRMANNQMTNYIMPTSADVPPIHVYFEEIPYAFGAFGAKGIGELPMDGPAPAILNAIHDALGESFDHVPLLPEDIFERLAGPHERN